MNEVIKCCSNCKFLSESAADEPCFSCINKSRWKSRDSEFKCGDLVVLKNDVDHAKPIYIYLRNNWALHVPNYVLLRSKCDYRFSYYMDKLIYNGVAERLIGDNFEYASHEDITEHDSRANRFYYADTLNKWFSELKNFDKTFTCPRITTADPKTTYQYQPKALITSRFIKDVIFHDPATIIFWKDGTKTVVKTQDGEKYDKEKGFAMAVCKKVFGNERDYYHVFKRWMRKGKEFKDYPSILNDICERIGNITPLDDTKPKGE